MTGLKLMLMLFGTTIVYCHEPSNSKPYYSQSYTEPQFQIARSNWPKFQAVITNPGEQPLLLNYFLPQGVSLYKPQFVLAERLLNVENHCNKKEVETPIARTVPELIMMAPIIKSVVFQPPTEEVIENRPELIKQPLLLIPNLIPFIKDTSILEVKPWNLSVTSKLPQVYKINLYPTIVENKVDEKPKMELIEIPEAPVLPSSVKNIPEFKATKISEAPILPVILQTGTEVISEGKSTEFILLEPPALSLSPPELPALTFIKNIPQLPSILIYEAPILPSNSMLNPDVPLGSEKNFIFINTASENELQEISEPPVLPSFSQPELPVRGKLISENNSIATPEIHVSPSIPKVPLLPPTEFVGEAHKPFINKISPVPEDEHELPPSTVPENPVVKLESQSETKPAIHEEITMHPNVQPSEAPAFPSVVEIFPEPVKEKIPPSSILPPETPPPKPIVAEAFGEPCELLLDVR